MLLLERAISLADVVLHQVWNFLNWNSEKCWREQKFPPSEMVKVFSYLAGLACCCIIYVTPWWRYLARDCVMINLRSIAINLEMTQPVLMTDGIYLPQPPLIQIDWKVFLIRPILRTRRWRHQTLSLYSWQNNPNSTRNVDNCPGLVINWINLGGGNRQNHQTERGDETGLARHNETGCVCSPRLLWPRRSLHVLPPDC